MNEVLPGLYKTPHEYPFWYFDRYKTSAYLLIRPEGNVVLYASGHLSAASEQIASLGGVTQQYLSHSHEATKRVERQRAALQMDLFCPSEDRTAVAKTCTVAGQFEGNTHVLPDLKAIALPGHTPGSSAFVWTTQGRRILFTGDNFYTGRQDLWSVYIKRANAPRVIESLRRLRAIEADYIAPCGCYHDTAVWPMTPTTWHAAIDTCIGRLEKGATR